MKAVLWNQFFNQLILVCGSVALIAIGSGASVGTTNGEIFGAQGPDENRTELTSPALEKCDEGDFIRQVLNFDPTKSSCQAAESPDSESCPWLICRNIGQRR